MYQSFKAVKKFYFCIRLLISHVIANTQHWQEVEPGLAQWLPKCKLMTGTQNVFL